MSHYFYKSEASTVVSAVQAWEQTRKSFGAQRAKLSQAFGAKASTMGSGTHSFVGGLNLSGSSDLNPHWCRPDQYGYRALRSNVIPPKGSDKEARATMRTEHKRLLDLWEEHCPKRIDSISTWSQLEINTGAIWMCGGIMFGIETTAYFCLGFEINQAEHIALKEAGKPSNGWIEGAVEILPSEYERVRLLKVGGEQGAQV